MWFVSTQYKNILQEYKDLDSVENKNLLAANTNTIKRQKGTYNVQVHCKSPFKDDFETHCGNPGFNEHKTKMSSWISITSKFNLSAYSDFLVRRE